MTFTVGLLGGAIAGAVLSFLPIRAEISIGLALVVGGGATLPVLRSLRDPDVRGAVLLYLEHDKLERRSWKADTGSGMPRTRAGMLRWAETHPSALQRAFLLLALGRLIEADRQLELVRPADADDELALELARQTSAIYDGRDASLDRVRDLLPTIGAPDLRRMRAECIAFLEATLAVASGGAPAAILGSRWRELAPAPRTRSDIAVVLKWMWLLISSPVIVASISLFFRAW